MNINIQEIAQHMEKWVTFSHAPIMKHYQH